MPKGPRGKKSKEADRAHKRRQRARWKAEGLTSKGTPFKDPAKDLFHHKEDCICYDCLFTGRYSFNNPKLCSPDPLSNADKVVRDAIERERYYRQAKDPSFKGKRDE